MWLISICGVVVGWLKFWGQIAKKVDFFGIQSKMMGFLFEISHCRNGIL